MRDDPRLALVVFFVGLAIAALVVLFVIAGDSEDAGNAPDIAFTGDAGQRAFDGLEVLRDDDGRVTDPPQVRGRGLVDRYVGIQSRLDEPIELGLDPDDEKQAEGANASARIGFLPDVTPGAYPQGSPPQLITTIRARARGVLVFRVRVKACARREEQPTTLAAGLRLVKGPGAERDALIQARESDGSLLAEPSARTPLGDRLQVLLPGCASG